MKSLISILSALFFSSIVLAQIPRTHVGNEWIDYTRTYHKLSVAEDGLYKISKSYLDSIGLSDINLNDVALFNLGSPVATYVSEDGILFYGKKNRGEFDRLAYKKDRDQLNPDYSMITDTAAYFLVVDPSAHIPSTSADYSVTSTDRNPIAYVWKKKSVNYINSFHKPQRNPRSAVWFSDVQPGEGYALNKRNEYSSSIRIPNIYKGNVDLDFSINAVTNIAAKHKIELSVSNETIGRIDGSSEFMIDTSYSINTSALSSNLPFTIEGKDSNLDIFSLANITITYPKECILSSDGIEKISIPESPNSSSLVRMRGFDRNKKYTIYNLSNNELYYPTVNEEGAIEMELPISDTKTDLFISAVENIKQPQFRYSTKFESLKSSTADYLIISNAKFIDDPMRAIQQYSDYRASSSGGGFTPKIMDIQDIYDQYGYGIDGHFYALRNLGKDLRAGWANLDHIFLMGKGVNYASTRKSAEARAQNYIPTYGFPTSDNLLFSDDELYSNFSIGRIAITEAHQILDYLDKVKTYEALPNASQTIQDKAWMKNVFQLAGGEARFLNYLKRLGKIIESNKLGAKLFTFSKSGSGDVDDSFFQASYDIINNGVSVINFMGHASVSIFEANLDDPQNYDNDGKTPLFFTMGCYSGDICSNTKGISENFVNIPKKGAIAFIANTWQSYPTDHYPFGERVFKNMGGVLYGSRLGEILKASLLEMPNTSSSDTRSFVQQLLLNGDPALKVLSFEGPDYIVDYSSIKIANAPVFASAQDFEVCFDIINLGSNVMPNDLPIQLPLNIKHLRPDNSIKTDSSIYVAMPKSTVNTCITLPLSDGTVSGTNNLFITIDSENSITEAPLPAAKNNNTLYNNDGEEGFEFNIISEGVFATIPFNYSIVNNTKVDFVSTNFNFFQDPFKLIFQIDTVPTFDSPYFTEKVVPKSIAPVTWTHDIMNKINQVYYWRISPDTTENDLQPMWNTNSFAYNPNNGSGWHQSHWGQYDDNESEEVLFNDLNQAKFSHFKRTITSLNSAKRVSRIWIDGNAFTRWKKNIKAGLAVLVFDPEKFLWKNVYGGENYGSVILKGKSRYYEFPANSEESENALINMLENIVPEGATVLVQTLQLLNDQYDLDYLSNQYQNNVGVLRYLESLGATRINDLLERDHVSYSFLFKKGSGILAEYISESKDENIDFSFDWFERNQQGSITTPLIGPASSFSRIETKQLSSGPDSTFYTIHLIDNDGNTEVLDRSNEMSKDLTQINASQYPFMRIVLDVKDTENRTPLLPEYFKVLYQDAPDFVARYNKGVVDSIEQGDSLNVNVAIQNISTENVDQLFDIKYKITDSKNKSVEKSVFFDQINAQDSINLSLTFDSRELLGNYTFSVIVNSEQNVLERNYQNNFGLFTFNVKGDDLKPEMDVTFDGRKIFNREIVQPNPQISIKFKDNKLAIFDTDSSSFDVKLRYPDGSERNVFKEFVDAQIIHNQEQNFSELRFSPRFEDGAYTLIARTKDHSNNKSDPYEIDFRVINKEGVSHVFNYPNPFSTSTQFIFTLTGSSVPNDMVLRIYTTSGKVVREFSKTELGPLKIGLNKSLLKWDGTDEYGKKLANGVYLYKLEVKNSAGESYKIFRDNTIQNQDTYFNNGFGKLVILR